jgi:Condensation domain
MRSDPIRDSYPLSPRQEEILLLSTAEPASGFHLRQRLIRLREPFCAVAFREAWNKILDRHSILRTSFRWEGLRRPVQEVYAHVQLPLVEQDWRNLPAAEQEQRLWSFLKYDRRRGFDVRQAPLLRIACFHCGGDDHHLVLSSHGLVLDSQAESTLLEELFAAYEAIRGDDELRWSPVRPYRAYIDWFQRQDWSRSEAFWRAFLKNRPGASGVFGRAAGLGAETTRGQQRLVPASLVEAIAEFAEKHELTPHTLLQGAHAFLLARASRQEESVFGVVRSCRYSGAGGWESTIGPFANILPMRVQCPPRMHVLDWLKSIRLQGLALREHEHTPLTKLKGWSDLATDEPLFDSVLIYEKCSIESGSDAAPTARTKREFDLLQKLPYPLAVVVSTDAKMPLAIDFCSASLDSGSVAIMADYLGSLLEAFVADGQQTLSDLPEIASTFTATMGLR